MIKIELETGGSVWKLLKKPGDQVKAGDTLFILEVMKMEVPYEAPADGEEVPRARRPPRRRAPSQGDATRHPRSRGERISLAVGERGVLGSGSTREREYQGAVKGRVRSGTVRAGRRRERRKTRAKRSESIEEKTLDPPRSRRVDVLYTDASFG